jgi:hypothetical protein
MPILPVINDPCMGKNASCYEKLERDEWIFWKKYKADEKILKDAQKENYGEKDRRKRIEEERIKKLKKIFRI